MSSTRTISASEFKAKCLNILDQLAARELDRVTITKRGRTAAILTPPPLDKPIDLYGCTRVTVVIPEGTDLTAPVLDETLDADLGILQHRVRPTVSCWTHARSFSW